MRCAFVLGTSVFDNYGLDWIGVGLTTLPKGNGEDWIGVGKKIFAFNCNWLDLSGVGKMSEQTIEVKQKDLVKKCELDSIGVGSKKFALNCRSF